jgi:hypothetical protein
VQEKQVWLCAGEVPGFQQHPKVLLARVAAFDAVRGGLPGVVGALDGTHSYMLRPKVSKLPTGARKTLYYNYKQQHSVLILTIADDTVRIPHRVSSGRSSEGVLTPTSAVS